MLYRKRMRAITVYVPDDVLTLIHEAIQRGDFDSISEAGRKALQDWAEGYREKRSWRQRWRNRHETARPF